MDKENFSVLLSIYYKETPEHLRQSLDSIFQQSVLSDDVVLVEDGKLGEDLEKTVHEYESKYPELHVVRFEKNRGLGFALNDGIKVCRHELVARMDTDDIAFPQRFEKELAIFHRYPDVGMVSSWIQEFQQKPGDMESIRRIPEFPEENLKYAKSRCPVNHPTVIYKKSEVLRAGGYQTNLFPEDYFLWIKMLQNGTRIYNIQEPLLWFRTSPDTFKRRGGWHYACDEAKTQWNIYKMGFINVPTLCKNVAIRFAVRIMPNSIRGMVYKIMRKQ